MDVNLTLKELRKLSVDIVSDDDNRKGPPTPCEERATEMAILFQALDEWVTTRGFLPLPWQRGRPGGGNAI
jgi:hypothetical protein